MLRAPLLAACALVLAAMPGATSAQKAESAKELAKEKARMQALRAQVRSYRCVTKAGRKYYGSTIPPQCTGELVEALSAQGTVLFRIDPPLTAEQRAAKEAEERKAAEAEAARLEAERRVQLQARRDQALLQTYASEEDIEFVRRRALTNNRAAAAQVQARIADLKRRQDQLSRQREQLKDGSTAAEKNHQDLRAAEYDLSLQEQLLESRNKEAAEINARYDEEKRKYRELTGGAKK